MWNFLLDLDYRAFQFFNDFAGRSVVIDAIIVAFAENAIFFMIIGLAFFRDTPQKRIGALTALASAFFGYIVFILPLRALFFRPRPFAAAEVVQLISRDSSMGAFPSGHATAMFALAFAAMFVNKKLRAVYIALAAISALARVSSGIHFPSDILAGAVLGALSALITKKLFDRFVRTR